jgi:hypothetical protein
MIVGLLALGGQSFAELCTVDAVPAATLLVPYFECDLDNPLNSTTLFSINNASAAPALAHVIFWTDWSFPTVDFDVYLTGYDVVTVNVCDVFDGNIPITADSPNDIEDADGIPNDGGAASARSPHQGVFSDNPHWDDTNPAVAGLQGFPFCDQIFPGFNNPVIRGNALNRLVQGHTGQPVTPLGGVCVGENFGDNVARGYITIDNVSECSLVLDPADDGLTGTPYFVDGGNGVVNDLNQLWGDWFLVDSTNNFAQGDTLVHIEAHPNLNALQIPLLNPDNSTANVPPIPAPVALVANATGYTFYGRYFPVLDGRDNREPLGTIWGSRYLNGGVFDQTQLIVWRDSTSADLTPDATWCALGPTWFPLNETEVVAFNEAEDAVEICFFTGGVVSPPDDDDPACFPYETGRYNVGDPPLDVPFNFGWLWLNLNLPPDNPTPDADFGTDGNIAQSYVTTLHSALGLFSVGLQAVEINDACQDFNDGLNASIENGGLNVIPFFN